MLLHFYSQDNPLKTIEVKPVQSWSNKKAKLKLQFSHIAIPFVMFGPKLNHYNVEILKKMWILLWLSPVDSGAHRLKPDWTQPVLSVSVKQLLALHIEKQLSNNCWQLCSWAHNPTFNQLLQLMCIHFHYCVNYLAASDLPLKLLLQTGLGILN